MHPNQHRYCQKRLSSRREQGPQWNPHQQQQSEYQTPVQTAHASHRDKDLSILGHTSIPLYSNSPHRNRFAHGPHPNFQPSTTDCQFSRSCKRICSDCPSTYRIRNYPRFQFCRAAAPLLITYYHCLKILLEQSPPYHLDFHKRCCCKRSKDRLKKA